MISSNCLQQINQMIWFLPLTVSVSLYFKSEAKLVMTNQLQLPQQGFPDATSLRLWLHQSADLRHIVYSI